MIYFTTMSWAQIRFDLKQNFHIEVSRTPSENTKIWDFYGVRIPTGITAGTVEEELKNSTCGWKEKETNADDRDKIIVKKKDIQKNYK